MILNTCMCIVYLDIKTKFNEVNYFLRTIILNVLVNHLKYYFPSMKNIFIADSQKEKKTMNITEV